MAAAFTVLEREWRETYQPSRERNAEVNGTRSEKGEAFAKAIEARHSGMMVAPMMTNDVDVVVAIWLMNALLRRNFAYSGEQLSRTRACSGRP